MSIQCCCLQAPALHAQLQEQLQEQVSCPRCSQAFMAGAAHKMFLTRSHAGQLKHACTQANGMGEGGLGGFQMGAGGGRQRQKPTSDFWWDVAGWVTLITAVSTLGMLASRANLPGPPTAPPMPK